MRTFILALALASITMPCFACVHVNKANDTYTVDGQGHFEE